MFKRIKLTILYMRDKNVSFIKKFLIIGSLLYLILPIDIVPDFIIGLGQIDDIAVLVFIWFALKSELDEYGRKQDLAGSRNQKVIPFETRKKDEN